MIDGMPARSSMAMPIGRRRLWGQSSVRKMATPSPIGTAMTMAMMEVVIVPEIAATAPNFSVTGFQTAEVRNPIPKGLKGRNRSRDQRDDDAAQDKENDDG